MVKLTGKIYSRRAQSIIEYAFILGVVTLVFVAMQTYLKRSLQTGIKIAADGLGRQEDSFVDTDPREGAIERARSRSTTPVPSSRLRIASGGGKQGTFMRDVRQNTVNATSKRMDDGYYYVEVGNGWSLHRKVWNPEN
jgi:hypothetical protein